MVAHDIDKLECIRCGLVRGGNPFTEADLETHYRSAYVLGSQADLAEPLLPVDGDLAPRSLVFFEWIRGALEQAAVPPPRRIVEVGCGEGRLLRRVADAWPAARAEGLEMSSAATDAARRRGLAVATGGFDDLAGEHDLIYAVAVLEHVPSPRAFFARAAASLSRNGALVVTQPAQDRPSSDIFFVDHLWHFASAHVQALAAAAGLVPAAVVPNPAVPTFSLHVFVHGDRAPEPAPEWPARHAAAQAIADLRATVDRLDAWLAARGPAPLAVWGVGQAFDLFRAYSTLADTPIAAGIDDNLARFAGGQRPFPVVALETAAATLENPDVLLTFAPTTRVRERLRAAGLRSFAALAEQPDGVSET